MHSALAVLDWRRQTFDLYRRLRGADNPGAAHAEWVRARDELLTTHPASPVPLPARASYQGADVARYDPAYRFVAAIQHDVEPQTREVVTGTDGVVPFERIGRVQLDDLGSLDVWWLRSYGGGLFLPFRDSAATSYGGGRYLIDTVKGADLGGGPEGLVVDLNFAYQPSCAYDEAWACPLAGPGNSLDCEVQVGEHYRPLERERA